MKLTEDKIQKETIYAKKRYERMKKQIEKYENDTNKDHGISLLECRSCFYLKGGIAGQAFTKYECKNCEKEKHHPNTNIPKYCNECAKEHNCCKRCASSLEM